MKCTGLIIFNVYLYPHIFVFVIGDRLARDHVKGDKTHKINFLFIHGFKKCKKRKNTIKTCYCYSFFKLIWIIWTSTTTIVVVLSFVCLYIETPKWLLVWSSWWSITCGNGLINVKVLPCCVGRENFWHVLYSKEKTAKTILYNLTESWYVLSSTISPFCHVFA